MEGMSRLFRDGLHHRQSLKSRIANGDLPELQIAVVPVDATVGRDPFGTGVRGHTAPTTIAPVVSRHHRVRRHVTTPCTAGNRTAPGCVAPVRLAVDDCGSSPDLPG